MSTRLLFRLASILVGLAASAFAQIDGAKFASDLRARLGPPLARETFRVGGEPAVEMIVDYSADGRVCGIQLPPYGSGSPGATAADKLISELIPLALRGKEKGRTNISLGTLSILIDEYENVLIFARWIGGMRIGISVSLKNEECRKPVAQ